ncbi:MAG TPA: hypothetical protein VFX18_01670 [Candidatus Nitrosocosmicus sp.]|nr:hypothetical protein [Candidatus Nitrosocosmicus sp.]
MDVVSLLFLNIIIPFSLSLIITILIIKFYNKIEHNKKIKHELEVKVFQIENQLKEQIEKSNFLEEQIEIVLSRTNQTNITLNLINSLITTLHQTIINKSISQYDMTSSDLNHVSSSNINQSQRQIDNDLSLQSHAQTYDNNHRNSTVEYILKKLENNSLTTREIQKQIGRTREHTSRLLKKLTDEKILERDMASKPFKYTITNEGRKLLIKHYASKNSHHSDVPKNIENLSDELKMS